VRVVRKSRGEGRDRGEEGASLYLLSKSLLKVGSDDKWDDGFSLKSYDSFAKSLKLSPENNESGNSSMDEVPVQGKSLLNPVSVETGYEELIKVHGVLYRTVACYFSIFSCGGMMGLFERLKEGLTKTRAGLTGKIDTIFASGTIDEETLEELEETLIASDFGVDTSLEVVEHLRQNRDRVKGSRSVRDFIKMEMADLLGKSQPLVSFGEPPFVILALGVNGVGKTTTIGKLASRFVSEGNSVVLAASDTFRAAAIEQLEIWAERSGSGLIKHQSGSDPAAVAFDAVEAARARGTDVVIVDTAGRLHTKSPLMEELKKVKRVIQRAMPDAPQEVLLVMDATTGQNALRQAQLFHDAVGVTGIALTKLDGTAKGGIIFAVKRELGIPVRLIGIGEGIDDLRDFRPEEFIEALFD
jgi:fused signal recognition particle receptor